MGRGGSGEVGLGVACLLRERVVGIEIDEAEEASEEAGDGERSGGCFWVVAGGRGLRLVMVEGQLIEGISQGSMQSRMCRNNN